MSHPPNLMTSDIGQQLRESEWVSKLERERERNRELSASLKTLHKSVLAYSPHRQHARLHQVCTWLHMSFKPNSVAIICMWVVTMYVLCPPSERCLKTQWIEFPLGGTLEHWTHSYHLTERERQIWLKWIKRKRNRSAVSLQCLLGRVLTSIWYQTHIVLAGQLHNLHYIIMTVCTGHNTHTIAYYRGAAMSRLYQWKGHNETFLLIVWEVGDKVGGQRKRNSSVSPPSLWAGSMLSVCSQWVPVPAHPKYMWRKGTSTAWAHLFFSSCITAAHPLACND